MPEVQTYLLRAGLPAVACDPGLANLLYCVRAHSDGDFHDSSRKLRPQDVVMLKPGQYYAYSQGNDVPGQKRPVRGKGAILHTQRQVRLCVCVCVSARPQPFSACTDKLSSLP